MPWIIKPGGNDFANGVHMGVVKMFLDTPITPGIEKNGKKTKAVLDCACHQPCIVGDI